MQLEKCTISITIQTNWPRVFIQQHKSYPWYGHFVYYCINKPTHQVINKWYTYQVCHSFAIYCQRKRMITITIMIWTMSVICYLLSKFIHLWDFYWGSRCYHKMCQALLSHGIYCLWLQCRFHCAQLNGTSGTTYLYISLLF